MLSALVVCSKYLLSLLTDLTIEANSMDLGPIEAKFEKCCLLNRLLQIFVTLMTDLSTETNSVDPDQTAPIGIQSYLVYTMCRRDIYIGESSNFPKSLTFETPILKLAICRLNIHNFKFKW